MTVVFIGETTPDERKEWRKRADDAGRLSRDFAKAFTHNQRTVQPPLPTHEWVKAILDWNKHEATCRASMLEQEEVGFGPWDRTPWGWLCFVEWCYEEYGALPSGT